MLPVKVGFLVSYDYNFLRQSLPPVYDSADKIVLAIDKNRLTWAGNPIDISADFFKWIEAIDTQKKIEIYEDEFYVKGLSSMECDTRERTMLGKYMGAGGWHVQVDADEYFVNFDDFVRFLHSVEHEHQGPVSVECEWIVLFKKTDHGYLMIEDGGHIPIATTDPSYTTARMVKSQKRYVYPQRILHDSWARTREEMLMKLRNWSHNNDFDIDAYYNYWLSLDEENYMHAKNIHPLEPSYWPRLKYIAAKDIPDLLKQIEQNKSLLKARRPPNKMEQLLQSFKRRLSKKINR